MADRTEDAPRPPAPDASLAAREVRIQQILKLHFRKVPHVMIAKVLKLHVSTVRSDIALGLRGMTAAAAGTDPFALFGESVYIYEELRSEALNVLAKTGEDHQLKLHAIRTASDLQGKLVEIAQGVGMLPKKLGTLRVQSEDKSLNERLRRLETDDVVTLYEEEFGAFGAEEKQRIMALDRASPGIPDPEGGGVRGAPSPVRGAGGRVLPPGPAGDVAGE